MCFCFFVSARGGEKCCKPYSPHRTNRHTGLSATQQSLSCFFSVLSFFPLLFFFLPEKMKYCKPHLPHRSNRHTALSFCFCLPKKEKMLHTSLATQAQSPHRSNRHTGLFSHKFFFCQRKRKIANPTCHTGLIATQDYFHTSFFFLPEKTKNCKPHLPHRSNRHTALSFCFCLPKKEKMLHTSLATQAQSPHRTIITQVYFVTGSSATWDQ